MPKNKDLQIIFMRSTILFVIFVLIAPHVLLARDRVDSAQRLRFLREATGQETSGDAFDARLDARFNVEADAARSVIATQDAAKRKQLANTGRVDALITTGLTEYDFQDKFKKKDGEEEQEEEDYYGEVNSKIDGLVDNTESQYLTRREKDFQEIEKNRAEELARQFRAEQDSTKSRPEDDDEDEEKENPYYFKPTASYTEIKNVIVNRIMQAGVDFDEAHDLIEGNADKEGVIMDLIEEFGFTYGQARGIFEFEE